MATAKEEVVRLLATQPADVTREELIRELAFELMVQRGMADSDAGRVISNVEMRQRITAWRR